MDYSYLGDITDTDEASLPLPPRWIRIKAINSNNGTKYRDTVTGVESEEHPLLFEAYNASKKYPLPSGWIIHQVKVGDKTTDNFYHNPTQRKSMWDPPNLRSCLVELLIKYGFDPVQCNIIPNIAATSNRVTLADNLIEEQFIADIDHNNTINEENSFDNHAYNDLSQFQLQSIPSDYFASNYNIIDENELYSDDDNNDNGNYSNPEEYSYDENFNNNNEQEEDDYKNNSDHNFNDFTNDVASLSQIHKRYNIPSHLLNTNNNAVDNQRKAWEYVLENHQEQNPEFVTGLSHRITGTKPPLSVAGVSILQQDVREANERVHQLLIKMRMDISARYNIETQVLYHEDEDNDMADDQSNNLHTVASASITSQTRDLVTLASDIVTTLRQKPEYAILAMSITNKPSSNVMLELGFTMIHRLLHPFSTDSSMTTAIILQAINYQLDELVLVENIFSELDSRFIISRSLFISEPETSICWIPLNSPLPVKPLVEQEPVLTCLLRLYAIRRDVTSYYRLTWKPIYQAVAVFVKHSSTMNINASLNPKLSKPKQVRSKTGSIVTSTSQAVQIHALTPMSTINSLVTLANRVLEFTFHERSLVSFPTTATAICRAIYEIGGEQTLHFYLINLLFLPNLMKILTGDHESVENEDSLLNISEHGVEGMMAKYFDWSIWMPHLSDGVNTNENSTKGVHLLIWMVWRLYTVSVLSDEKDIRAMTVKQLLNPFGENTTEDELHQGKANDPMGEGMTSKKLRSILEKLRTKINRGCNYLVHLPLDLSGNEFLSPLPLEESPPQLTATEIAPVPSSNNSNAPSIRSDNKSTKSLVDIDLTGFSPGLFAYNNNNNNNNPNHSVQQSDRPTDDNSYMSTSHTTLNSNSNYYNNSHLIANKMKRNEVVNIMNNDSNINNDINNNGATTGNPIELARLLDKRVLSLSYKPSEMLNLTIVSKAELDQLFKDIAVTMELFNDAFNNNAANYVLYQAITKYLSIINRDNFSTNESPEEQPIIFMQLVFLYNSDLTDDDILKDNNSLKSRYNQLLRGLKQANKYEDILLRIIKYLNKPYNQIHDNNQDNDNFISFEYLLKSCEDNLSIRNADTLMNAIASGNKVHPTIRLAYQHTKGSISKTKESLYGQKEMLRQSIAADVNFTKERDHKGLQTQANEVINSYRFGSSSSYVSVGTSMGRVGMVEPLQKKNNNYNSNYSVSSNSQLSRSRSKYTKPKVNPNLLMPTESVKNNLNFQSSHENRFEKDEKFMSDMRAYDTIPTDLYQKRHHNRMHQPVKLKIKPKGARNSQIISPTGSITSQTGTRKSQSSSTIIQNKQQPLQFPAHLRSRIRKEYDTNNYDDDNYNNENESNSNSFDGLDYDDLVGLDNLSPTNLAQSIIQEYQNLKLSQNNSDHKIVNHPMAGTSYLAHTRSFSNRFKPENVTMKINSRFISELEAGITPRLRRKTSMRLDKNGKVLTLDDDPSNVSNRAFKPSGSKMAPAPEHRTPRKPEFLRRVEDEMSAGYESESRSRSKSPSRAASIVSYHAKYENKSMNNSTSLMSSDWHNRLSKPKEDMSGAESDDGSKRSRRKDRSPSPSRYLFTSNRRNSNNRNSISPSLQRDKLMNKSQAPSRYDDSVSVDSAAENNSTSFNHYNNKNNDNDRYQKYHNNYENEEYYKEHDDAVNVDLFTTISTLDSPFQSKINTPNMSNHLEVSRNNRRVEEDMVDDGHEKSDDTNGNISSVEFKNIPKQNYDNYENNNNKINTNNNNDDDKYNKSQQQTDSKIKNENDFKEHKNVEKEEIQPPASPPPSSAPPVMTRTYHIPTDDEVKLIVTNGFKAMKHGRTGAPKFKVITCDLSNKHIVWNALAKSGFASLFSNANNQISSISFDSIMEIRKGIRTDILSKSSVLVDPSCCLSIITSDRTLDLHFVSKSDRDAVGRGLFIVLNENGFKVKMVG
eukprot:gene5026-7014_t